MSKDICCFPMDVTTFFFPPLVRFPPDHYQSEIASADEDRS